MRTTRPHALLRLSAGALAVLVIAPCAVARSTEASLAPLPGEDVRDFGRVVCLDGARGLGAGSLQNGPDPWPGRVFVFERAQAAWTTTAELVAANRSEAYGNALALSGDVAVVGDAGAGEGSPAAATALGAVHVFTFDGLSWSLAATLQSGVPGDGFGRSVALEGDTLVVGAPDLPSGATVPQPVRVYRLVNGTWTKVQELLGVDTVAGDRFGHALDTSGGLLVVGAPFDLDQAGSAYVFESTAGTFAPTAKMTLGAVAVSAWFGRSVAVDDGRFVVGAPAWSAGKGIVTLFEKVTGLGWTPVHTFQRGLFGSVFDQFGTDVDLDGPRVVIGTPGESRSSSGFGLPIGVAYVAEEEAGTWSSLHRLLPAGASNFGFGTSVAVSGERVAAGNPEKLLAGEVDVDFVRYAGEPLDASTDTISVAQGGTQALRIDLPAQAVAGHPFLILGSLSGSAPGIPLPNGATLPLVVDPYFLFTFANPIGGLLVPGQGTLNGAGNADAVFVVPGGAFPSAVGLTLHHACVTFAPGTFDPTAATNAVAVTFVP